MRFSHLLISKYPLLNSSVHCLPQEMAILLWHQLFSVLVSHIRNCFFPFLMSGLIYNTSFALSFYFTLLSNTFNFLPPTILCPCFKLLILFDNCLFHNTVYLILFIDLLLYFNLRFLIYIYL